MKNILLAVISLIILTLISCENKEWLSGRLTKEDEASIRRLVSDYILESTKKDFQDNRENLQKFFSPDYDFFFPGEMFEAYVFDSFSIKGIEFDSEKKEYKVAIRFHLIASLQKENIRSIKIESIQYLWLVKNKGKWAIKSIYKPDIYSLKGIQVIAKKYQKDFPKMSNEIMEKF